MKPAASPTDVNGGRGLVWIVGALGDAARARLAPVVAIEHRLTVDEVRARIAQQQRPDLLMVASPVDDDVVILCCDARDRFGHAELPILLLAPLAEARRALAAGATSILDVSAANGLDALDLCARSLVAVRREHARAQRAAAERVNQVKSAFLTNMTHELRTPLHAVLGFAQMLEADAALDGAQHDRAVTIRRSGERLLALVDDVLELSRNQAGDRPSVLDRVDLGGLLDDVLRHFQPQAAAKRLSFEISRAPDLPACVITDEQKVRRVLLKLCGNAVKFTADGGVLVRASVRPWSDGAPSLHIVVEDTGPGIAPDSMSKLFQPFEQEQIGVESTGGTGLGLAVARALARSLDGDVTAAPRPGGGSIFEMEVPVTIPAAAPPPSSRSRPSLPMPLLGRPVGPPLPASLREPLRAAVRIADIDRIVALVAALPPEHNALAAALRGAAERYAYDEIGTLLET